MQGISELRNQLGLGHGRTTRSNLHPRHARLALNSTVTVTEFLLDTWHARIAAGKIPSPSKD
ncbi:abortive infection family protein [Pseudarthrobacter albicanus]|uniref:abortive infection family protein n=1 Tax=Pseudarthrobacter albicanus TaxID=2823873 RepID=UPI001BADEA02